MPIKELKYKSLHRLIHENLSKEEDLSTHLLIKSLRPVKTRGWLSKKELIEICYWKSPRVIRHIESNHPHTIKKVSKAAFASKSEQLKMEQLTCLKGVSIPMASAILTLTNPEKYGVIDIRVWQLVHRMGLVKTNPKGTNFNFKEWYRLLEILQHYAQKFNVSARAIEKTIFFVHKQHQDGLLYENLTTLK